MTIREQVKAARGAGVPLILITTPDQPAMVRHLAHGWNGDAPPILSWDCARSLFAVSPAGEEVRGALNVNEPADLLDVLNAFDRAPERTIVIVSLANRVTDNPAAIQALLNNRDACKTAGRTIILLAPGPALPPELSSDALILDDAYPTEPEVDEAIGRTLTEAREAFEVEEPDETTRRAARAALLGLPAFPIEQSLALSLQQHRRLAVDDLLGRKRAIVGQVRGLSMNRTELTLDHMGGLREAIAFGAELFHGEESPRVVVIAEEMEKAIAGFGTETSGTTGDQVSVLLTRMEDEHYSGMMAAGPPGSGKSQFSKSLGATFGATVLTLDLGAAKGSLVGQSEQQIRAALKTIAALAGNTSRVFFVASVNRMANIPTELRRRFRAGIWFFDLPTVEERAAIWPIHLRAFNLPLDAARPDDTDWTGAEIRNCCEFAWRFHKTPADVAHYITPIAQADPETLLKLRQAAAGRWNSASYPGVYRMPAKPSAPSARAFTKGA